MRGDFTGASDIDILVVTEKVDRKYDMMVRVYREGYERWYKRFIDEGACEDIVLLEWRVGASKGYN